MKYYFLLNINFKAEMKVSEINNLRIMEHTCIKDIYYV